MYLCRCLTALISSNHTGTEEELSVMFPSIRLPSSRVREPCDAVHLTGAAEHRVNTEAKPIYAQRRGALLTAACSHSSLDARTWEGRGLSGTCGKPRSGAWPAPWRRLPSARYPGVHTDHAHPQGHAQAETQSGLQGRGIRNWWNQADRRSDRKPAKTFPFPADFSLPFPT